MLGLVIRMVQLFVADTYGPTRWREIAAAVRLRTPDIEAMLHYDPAVMTAILETAERRLDRPRSALLEDLGTYLVIHPHMQPVRRLLRFCGDDFLDFLHSLEDLPGRVRLALPELDLPTLELTEAVAPAPPNRAPSNASWYIACTGDLPGFGHVLVGLLRAMADDHGALVVIDHAGTRGTSEWVRVTLVDERFASGRSFDLMAAPCMGTRG